MASRTFEEKAQHVGRLVVIQILAVQFMDRGIVDNRQADFGLLQAGAGEHCGQRRAERSCRSESGGSSSEISMESKEKGSKGTTGQRAGFHFAQSVTPTPSSAPDT